MNDSNHFMIDYPTTGSAARLRRKVEQQSLLFEVTDSIRRRTIDCVFEFCSSQVVELCVVVFRRTTGFYFSCVANSILDLFDEKQKYRKRNCDEQKNDCLSSVSQFSVRVNYCQPNRQQWQEKK